MESRIPVIIGENMGSFVKNAAFNSFFTYHDVTTVKNQNPIIR